MKRKKKPDTNPDEMIKHAILLLGLVADEYNTPHAYMAAVTAAVYERMGEELCAFKAAALTAAIATGVALSVTTEAAEQHEINPRNFLQHVSALVHDDEEFVELLRKRDGALAAQRLEAQFNMPTVTPPKHEGGELMSRET